MRRFSAAVFASVFALAGCKATQPTPMKSAEATTAPLAFPPGLDEKAMNQAADPCTDFYEYACGNWLTTTEIPADRARWSRSFDTINEANEKMLRTILEEASTGKAPEGTPHAEKLGQFYAACMDESALENALPALQAKLNGIAAPKNGKELATTVGQLHAQGIGVLFRFGSTQDYKDATRVIGEFDQGGLGLPDRDYYLDVKDPKKRVIREAYQQYVAKMFGLSGEKPEVAAASAKSVMEFETQLARASLSRVERRSPEKLYHLTDRSKLATQSPGFDWNAYLTSLGAADAKIVNVTHPVFFTEVGKQVKATPAATWRTYLRWHTLRSLVPALPRRFQDETFAFTSTHLTGAKEDLPRWKKCVGFADAALGEALAVPFIAKTFGTDGKAKTREMVAEVVAAFEKNLPSRDWMDDATREAALVKVKKIVEKIGYPDAWRSYDALKVERTSFLHSVLAANQFETARDLAKIGKPVDRGEWYMTPPTVNAYYNPLMNEIVFPAGILQPPFFNRAATDAVNFGAMGMVVGHEITHGFDDEGRKFDADGNLKTWWTPTAEEAFAQRVSCVKEQFDTYVAIDDVKVNGALTLGENVADLGGLKLAYAAMQAYLAKHPTTEQHRLTQPQQFFVGYAQSWCSKYRPEMARMRALTDPHAPPFLRVNGPLRNLPQFQEAFSCKEGSPMVRPAAERCEIW